MRNQGGRKKPTPRRIEPKSTFGIYIPADIPQEACDFLNVLKDNGSYSNDVVEIIVQYLEVRKFLNAQDPLDDVSGNLLEQIQALVGRATSLAAGSTSAQAHLSDSPDDESILSDDLVDQNSVEEQSKPGGPGFDLNKMLQRMRRNKQLGAVNHLSK